MTALLFMADHLHQRSLPLLYVPEYRRLHCVRTLLYLPQGITPAVY